MTNEKRSHSIKASVEGLEVVEAARLKKRWNRTAIVWCDRAFTSRATLSRFWAGRSLRQDTFAAICRAVDVDWRTVADLPDANLPDASLPGTAVSNTTTSVASSDTLPVADRPTAITTQDSPVSDPPTAKFIPYQDWGFAPDVTHFYGRDRGLACLSNWILQERCRVVTLLGMGGIGKTALTSQFARQKKDDFDIVIWRSLRNAPQFGPLVTEVIDRLGGQIPESSPTASTPQTNRLILQLIDCLRAHRCLLILDNVESILQGDDLSNDLFSQNLSSQVLSSQPQAGCYRPGYEAYQQLFTCIGETNHQSCLVLTSREQPKGLMGSYKKTSAIRCLQMDGLSYGAAKAVVSDEGAFVGSAADWQRVIEHYGSNPLALKIVAAALRDNFEGNLANFLQTLEQEVLILEDVRSLLEQQFCRLGPLEQSVMHWLAINREPVSLQAIQEDLLYPVSTSQLMQAISSLQHRSLIEKVTEKGSDSPHVCYTQQPVVMEFISDRLIEQVFTELAALFKSPDPSLNTSVGNPLKSPQPLLSQYALLKAQSKEFIKEAQRVLLVTPILNRLTGLLGRSDNVIAHLIQILRGLRGQSLQTSGYAGGNLFNFLRQLKVDLCGHDFSHLVLRQADLQNIPLTGTSFAHTDLAKSVFTKAFGSIWAVAISPDGSCIATGDGNNQVHLWCMSDGHQLMTLKGHTNWVLTVAFSPDGQLLASGSDDGTVRLWNKSDGQLLRILQGHENSVTLAVFSPDGQWLATSSRDHTVKVWNVLTGQAVKTLTGHTQSLWSVAFSPDGKRIASASADQTVRLWDWQSAKPSSQVLSGHTGWVWSVAFSPNGKLLATGGDDHIIRLWQTDSGKHLDSLEGHTQEVRCVAFSQDGALLASSSDDNTIRIWQMRTIDHSLSPSQPLAQPQRVLKGHANSIWSVAFGKGHVLASGSTDQTIRLWDALTGQSIRTLQGYTKWLLSVACSPDGSQLASSSNDHTISLWDKETGDLTCVLQGHTNWVWSVAYSPGGTQLASGSDDHTVRLWDLKQQAPLKLLQGHQHWVLAVAYSPNGQVLASSSADCTVRLWNTQTGQLLKTLSGHTDWVRSVAFSPDGKRLVSGGVDQSIRLWDSQSGESLATIKNPGDWVRSVVFSPDGKWLASGGTDHSLKLWDAATGQRLQTLEGHQDWIISVAFSPDGELIATSSTDKTIKLWHCGSGKLLRTLSGHDNTVQSVVFHPDGQTLVSSSKDQTIRLWQIETGRCTQVIRANQPYKGMNITGVQGISDAQRETLKLLGAVNRAPIEHTDKITALRPSVQMPPVEQSRLVGP